MGMKEDTVEEENSFYKMNRSDHGSWTLFMNHHKWVNKIALPVLLLSVSTQDIKELKKFSKVTRKHSPH